MGNVGPANAGPESGKRRLLFFRLAMGLLVTTSLFLLLWRYVDWPRLLALLARTDRFLVSITLVGYSMLYMSRAFRFVLLSPRTPYLTMVCITSVHNFMLRLMPMRTGDLSYAFLIRRAGQARLGQGVISLLLVRVVDMGTVLLLFGLTLALNRGIYRGDALSGLVAAAAVLLLGVVSVIFFGRLLSFGARLLRRTLARFGLTRREKVANLLDTLDAEIDGFAKLSPATLLKITVVTVVQWLLNFAIIFAIMRAFSIRVSVAQAVLGGTAAVVSNFLPIGGIGSFGALEAGWALGFSLVGIDSSEAVASAFGFSIVTFVYAALLGLFGWIGLSLIIRRSPQAES